jgi:hypothetical protein
MTPVTITGQYGDDTFVGVLENGARVRVAGNGTSAHLTAIVDAIVDGPKVPKGQPQPQKADVELILYVDNEDDITVLRTTGKGRK